MQTETLVDFRFLRLRIWKESVKLGSGLLDVATRLRADRDFALADQLMRAALSMSNNIAEGAGSYSAQEFAYFLNVARRSAFENASMIVLLRMRGRLTEKEATRLLARLYRLSRRISALRDSVRSARPRRRASKRNV